MDEKKKILMPESKGTDAVASGSGYEIERKFLIEYPDTDALSSMTECRSVEIVQTYLVCDEDATIAERRVRMTEADGKKEYFLTVKSVGGLVREENEQSISREEYDAYLALADKERVPIRKTRYKLPFDGHTVEIDVYPFSSERAIAEVELADKDEAFTLPPFISVIKEVTLDPSYKNSNIARRTAL